MSDNLNDVTLNWDNEVDQIDESGPRVITDYGAIQYLGAKKVQLFSAGNKVGFPNFITEGPKLGFVENAKPGDGKPYERGGMKEGHVQGGKNAIAHFIAYFGQAFNDDKPFVTVRVFTTQAGIPVDAAKIDGYPVIALDEKQKAAQAEGKTVWLSDWSNLQFPALRQLAPAMRTRFTNGEKLFFKADNWNTGAKPQEDRNGKVNAAGELKKYYDNFWFNFTIFNTEAEMLTARAAAKGSNGSGVDYTGYPVTWKGDEGNLDVFVVGEYNKNKALTMATMIEMAGISGEAIGGGEVEAVALLRKIMAGAMPAPMLESWLAK